VPASPKFQLYVVAPVVPVDVLVKLTGNPAQLLFGVNVKDAFGTGKMVTVTIPLSRQLDGGGKSATARKVYVPTAVIVTLFGALNPFV
jgi:hypothetical protein